MGLYLSNPNQIYVYVCKIHKSKHKFAYIKYIVYLCGIKENSITKILENTIIKYERQNTKNHGSDATSSNSFCPTY